MIRQQIGANETVNLPGTLSEPHFDDEATVLSARRVVPLDQLRDTTRSRRRLVVALAVTSTLLLGVLGGVFYAQLGEQIHTQTADEARFPPIGDHITTKSSEDDESGGALDEPKLVVVEKGNNGISNPVRRPDSVAANPAPRRTKGDNDQTALSRIERNAFTEGGDQRDIHRAERRRTRLRRVAPVNVEPVDDLLRIREIFEGPSRP